jgi:hypothetical protein
MGGALSSFLGYYILLEGEVLIGGLRNTSTKYVIPIVMSYKNLAMFMVCDNMSG